MDRHLVIALGITLVTTGFIYGSNLDHSFQYDDAWKIVENPQLHKPGTYIDSLLYGAGYREAATRLLPNLTLALNYRLGELNPTGYHLVNLVFHLMNVILVALFAAILGRQFGIYEDSPVPVLAATLFALHPLNSEAVSYANARPNLMVTTFYLGALLSLLLALQTERKLIRRLAWLGFAITVPAALLSKELAITLVLMAPLLVELLAPHDRGLAERRPLVRRLSGALWLIGGMSLLVTGALSGVARVVGTAGPSHTGSIASYLALTWLGQTPVLLQYLLLAVLPAPTLLNACRNNQHLYQRMLSEGQLVDGALGMLVVPIASLGILATLGWLLVRHRRKQPLIFLCGVWIAITHAPHTLMPRGEVMVEYRTYLPMVGTCIALAVGINALVERLLRQRAQDPGSERRRVVALIALPMLLALATGQRMKAWETVPGFWRDVLRKEPDSPRAHNGLGDQARRRGELDEAARQYRAAIEGDPSYAPGYSNLGTLLATRGRYKQAKPLLERALALDSTSAYSYSNLANVLTELGQLDPAIELYRKALSLKPQFLEGHMNLGRAYLLKQEPAKAITSYRACIKTDDHFAPAYRELGRAQLAAGQLVAALETLEQAVALAPNDAEAHFQFARAFAYNEQAAQAQAQLAIALRLSPRHKGAHMLARRLKSAPAAATADNR